MAQKRAHLWIHGYVQGVGFRQNTRQKALQLGLSGWVRNLPGGGVEVVAEGEEQVLRELIAWCHRGPTWAEVDNVQVQWESYKGEFSRFSITW